MTLDTNRERALDLAVSQIEKQFGKGAIMKLGEQTHIKDLQVVSTGSIGLDLALGVGGVPRGRVIEIYGPESSGKTTLALQILAQAQKLGGIGAFIDAEHALDVSYARKLGVTTEDLLISQPDHGEQALEIAETLVRSGAVDVLVVDSVAALVPRAEIEGEMGEPQMGLQARLMSQALRKLTGTISRSNTIVIFINQIRMKIGVMFGNPETTTGGNALKFYSSASTSAASAPSSKATRSSAAVRKCASSKTRLHHRSKRPSSISCTAAAFRARAKWSTWVRNTVSWRRVARGTRSMGIGSVRGEKTPRNTCASIPT